MASRVEMTHKTLLVLLSLFAVSMILVRAIPNDITLTGNTTDCFQASRVQVPKVTVSAFDPANNRPMMSLLRTMDTANFSEDDPDSMTRFGRNYAQLVSFLKASPVLARAVSGPTGSFSLSLTATDSVLVVGLQETEDEPYYYGYSMVGGRTDAQIMLDMSRGGCDYLDSLGRR